MKDEVATLISFLDDPRAEAREMAAQGVAGYTATPEGTAGLLRHHKPLYEALNKLLERAPAEAGSGEAAASAAAAFVNLSQHPAERMKILDTSRAVAAAAGCIATVDEPPELAEYASMLLSNLTQLPAGVEQLLAAGTPGATPPPSVRPARLPRPPCLRLRLPGRGGRSPPHAQSGRHRSPCRE